MIPPTWRPIVRGSAQLLALPGRARPGSTRCMAARCSTSIALAGNARRSTADASITAAPGRVCVVMVADCLPVLFASRDGAAHWRGARRLARPRGRRARTHGGGARRRAGGALGLAGARDLAATLRSGRGGARCVRGADAGAAACFSANERGRWQADLVGLARRRLRSLGRDRCPAAEMVHVTPTGEHFFSHRRDGKGRPMAALIWKE